MKKSKSGIIAILATDGKNPAYRKALDIKTTPSYPSITIPNNITIEIPSQGRQLNGFQHLTIPPDLNIHFTNSAKNREFFTELSGTVDENGNLISDYIKVFTLINLPIKSYPIFTQRSYSGGGEVIALPRFPHWTDQTGFILEVFAVKNNHRNIPKEEHFSSKEMGTMMPIDYQLIYGVKNNRKKTTFFLLPFVITYHKTRENIMTFYPGSADKPFREI